MPNVGVENVRQLALESATALFWSKGAEVASYNDIVAATGLSRKALYGLWPDKEAIVRDTLAHYRTEVLSGLVAPLRDIGGQAGVAAFWRQLEAASRGTEWRGCYLFRTASGPLRAESFVSDALEAYLSELSTAFAAEISRAQSDGDIAQAIDPKIAGLQATALLAMISTLGARAGYNDQVRDYFAAARVSCGLAA